MSVLDVFKGDAYSLVEMTLAMETLPYVPSRLGAMGLFQPQPVTTATVGIEEKGGKLQLIPTVARGTMPNVGSGPKRRVRKFEVPCLQQNMTVMASDVQGIRAFNSADNTDSVATLVNEKLSAIKQNIETTIEYHRIGAIKGIVLDADGATEIYDLFDEFGVAQDTVEFAMVSGDLVEECDEVIELIEEELSGMVYNHIHALCGKNFFKALKARPDVREVLLSTGDPDYFTKEQKLSGGAIRGFEWNGIIFEAYRGKVGNVDFIGADEAHFFPVGVNGLFQIAYAPAEFIETVNTPGKPFYAKQLVLPWDTGVEIHGQSNPLAICTRPKVLVKGTIAEEEEGS